MADLFVVRMARPIPTNVNWRELVVLLEWILLWSIKESVGRIQSAAEPSLDVSRRGIVSLICPSVIGSQIVVMVLMRVIVIQIVAVASSGKISF